MEDSVREMENKAAARDYAWKWFQLHAGQRQTVFQFFLAIIGAVLAGYFALLHAEPSSCVARFFGLLIMGLSFLFWRLDCRGSQLVKIAERYLKTGEEKLALSMQLNEIKLVANADADKGGYRYLEWVHSFRQIYQYIFGLIALLGLVVLLR